MPTGWYALGFSRQPQSLAVDECQDLVSECVRPQLTEDSGQSPQAAGTHGSRHSLHLKFYLPPSLKGKGLQTRVVLLGGGGTVVRWDLVEGF